MKKEKANKEVRNERPKRTFLDWYKEDQATKKKAKKSIWFWYMPMVGLFVIVANLLVSEKIGDGAFSYNEYTYEELSYAISESIYQVYSEDGEFEAAGIDEVKLKELVDNFTREYEAGGVSSLKCTKKDGYFVATVTAELDDSYNILETVKNFNSRAEYVATYRKKVIFWTCILGIGAWLAIGGVGILILKTIVAVYEVFGGKSSEDMEESKSSKENENEKATKSEAEKGKEETKLEVVSGNESVKTA